jgi:hypothetical protein
MARPQGSHVIAAPRGAPWGASVAGFSAAGRRGLPRPGWALGLCRAGSRGREARRADGAHAEAVEEAPAAMVRQRQDIRRRSAALCEDSAGDGELNGLWKKRGLQRCW